MALRIGLASHCGSLAHVTRDELNWNGSRSTGALQLAGEVLRIPRLNLNLNSNLQKRQRSKLNLVTINIPTANGKEEELIEVMKEKGLTIVGICETRITGECNKVINNNYRVICSCK